MIEMYLCAKQFKMNSINEIWFSVIRNSEIKAKGLHHTAPNIDYSTNVSTSCEDLYISKITSLLLESYTSDTLLGHVPTCLSNDLLCAVLLRVTVIHQELGWRTFSKDTSFITQ